MTPLLVAVSKSYKEIIWLLIDKGADINVKDNEGNSPLHNSLIDKEIAELLIGKGADVTALNNSGESVLWEQRRTDIIEYLIGEGVNVNAKDKHGKSIVDLWEREEDDNGEMAALLRTHGGRSIVDELRYSVKDLNERVTALEKTSTNPTDEWPRKMWEIDLESEILDVMSHPYLKQGFNNNAVVAAVSSIAGQYTAYWISSDGSFYEFKNSENSPIQSRHIIHLDDDNLIYYSESRNFPEQTFTVNYLHKKDDEVITAQFTRPHITSRGFGRGSAGIAHNDNQGFTVQISWEGTKITGWDFTPPSSTAPKPDDGNGGGNGGGDETVNSRLIIKTSGPDIALATDGKLGGAAELQKSNDLRSWRRLGDVPEEASEVLVTPRESGNEFYRLKKK
jgi:hypothetical protein